MKEGYGETIHNAGRFMAAQQSSIYIEYDECTSSWHVWTDCYRRGKDDCRYYGWSDESLGEAWEQRKKIKD